MVPITHRDYKQSESCIVKRIVFIANTYRFGLVVQVEFMLIRLNLLFFIYCSLFFLPLLKEEYIKE